MLCAQFCVMLSQLDSCSLQDRLKAFYLPLVDPSEDIPNPTWRALHAAHNLETAALPLTVKQFVQTMRGQFPGQDPVVWRDENGRSPLHVAISHNFVAVVGYLIDTAGMDPNTPYAGLTPLDVAVSLEYFVLAAFLRERGAKQSSVVEDSL